MVTYPSTHGVFEAGIAEICDIVHGHGGQVYVDGANLNAMVGLAAPGAVRRRRLAPEPAQDLLHPARRRRSRRGSGRRCARTWRRSCPGIATSTSGANAIGAVSRGAVRQRLDPADLVDVHRDDGRRGPHAARPRWRSSTRTTSRGGSAPHYPVLYSGPGGLVAHECILDLRPIKEASGITVEDVAKRLMDYGFHAPTMSFPVAGTLMIEPTESESQGRARPLLRRDDRHPRRDPRGGGGHASTARTTRCATRRTPRAVVLADDWKHQYSRELAAYPAEDRCATPSTGRPSGASTTSTATATSSAAACRSASTSDSGAARASYQMFARSVSGAASGGIARERGGELGHVLRWAAHAEARRRVAVGPQEQALLLRADRAAPGLRERDEEALLGREAVDRAAAACPASAFCSAR